MLTIELGGPFFFNNYPQLDANLYAIIDTTYTLLNEHVYAYGKISSLN